ncbi:transport and Golgi organization protein 6 homolog [Sitophilus oryzae]|uniref:Transport and Golgi organization protein 6 homolog n=1 Tax=Sitophilus oryzae TaxID=7048 RepID=A0A6J2Y4B3_SITOR|nr:transport and Golgi organization protein 6 homolog [Sitophilus oryzae]
MNKELRKMNKTELITLLSNLEVSTLPEGELLKNSSVIFGEKNTQICTELDCDYDQISSSLENITKHYFSNSAITEWTYLLGNFYVLRQITITLQDSKHTELLSVKEIAKIKKCVVSLVKIGISTKLLPNLPFAVNETYTVTDDIFYQYNILKCTILALTNFLKSESLRVIILTNCLGVLLSGLYQIAFCPIKKELSTQDIYNRLINEKQMTLKILQQLKEHIHPNIYVKETMIIFQKKSPPWFKKAVSQTLTNILFSPNGVESVAVAMLLNFGNDQTKSWKALDILYRLLSSCKSLPNFKDNICKQILGLLDKTTEDSLILERLFIICTKRFYFECHEIGKDVFLRKVISELLFFTCKEFKFENVACTEKLKKTIRLLFGIFVENTVDYACLPIEIIKPVLSVIFRIFALTVSSIFKTTHKETRLLIQKYLESNNNDIVVFDSLIYGINAPQQILSFRNDIELFIETNEIVVKHAEHSVVYSVCKNCEVVVNLLESRKDLLKKLFIYLLNCLNNKQKYFQRSDDRLLTLENEIMNEYFERYLSVYKLLSTLAEDKDIQKLIVESPQEIIVFIKQILEKSQETGVHKSSKFECDEFQTLFTVILVLNALIGNTSKINKMFDDLIEPLQTISNETKHSELRTLIEQILNNLKIDKSKSRNIDNGEKSTLDVVVEDICDPLLPVRGHGLMALKKLVEKKDPSVVKRMQYVLTIFQQNVKNDDSFIYLSAIDGLTAMADVFPDTVLNILCEEYSDFTKKDKDSNEIRMKLGEVLVRVTKILGEMAPKYKSLLLNTFLSGTKDEDHLVRASALSNLGEICRVLGYKLGSVVTEVLVCVHAVITTDKAPEARRAAVTVIRQLLAGLESETIAFLKEDILPIYRTLKQIYRDDKDDVMRLQAQLALEELNENMKNFVFPKPQLSMEKKIIMLD